MKNWYTELKAYDVLGDMVVAVAENTENRFSDEEPRKMFGTLDECREMLDKDFDAGYGGTNGNYFTAWTKDDVFFPVCYDGAEWIGRVPRNPEQDGASRHKGGG